MLTHHVLLCESACMIIERIWESETENLPQTYKHRYLSCKEKQRQKIISGKFKWASSPDGV